MNERTSDAYTEKWNDNRDWKMEDSKKARIKNQET